VDENDRHNNYADWHKAGRHAVNAIPAIDVDNWAVHVNEPVAKLALEQVENVGGICRESNASHVIRVGRR
jgi:hypothetical protein